MIAIPTRQIGSTGVAVTELSFGAASLGNLYRKTTEEEACGAIDAAWDLGIRYFDTAPHYGLGLSERRLAVALGQRPRTEFVLSTKVGRLIRPNPRPTEVDDEGFIVPGNLRRVWDFTAEGVRRSIQESLERLGLDYIDIAYAHDPDQFSSVAAWDALEALAELRAEGLIRAIGVGTNSAEQVRALCQTGLPDVMMLAGRYTLLDQVGLDTALEPAHAAGVAVVAVGVFNSGILSTPRPDAAAKYDYGEVPPAILERARHIAEICHALDVDLPAAAIAFPLMHPAVVSVGLGMRSAGQVRENVARFQQTFPTELWTELVKAGLLDPRTTDTEMTKSH